MVFLRPTIIRDHRDAAAVTNEKYSFIRGLQHDIYNNQKDGVGLLDDTAPLLPTIEQIDRSKQTVEKTKTQLDIDNDDWDDDDDNFI
jgi:type II secretory pathway component GspD/PulD (secretin)